MRGGSSKRAAVAAAAAAVAAFASGLDAAAAQDGWAPLGSPPDSPPRHSPAGGRGADGASGDIAGSSAPYWRFLGGVAAGDSFAYRICDSLYGPLAQGAHGPHAPRRGDGRGGWACYLAEMHVEAVVPVSGGRGASYAPSGAGADVYVVRAAVEWGGGGDDVAGDAGDAGGNAAGTPRHRPESVLLVVDAGGGSLAVRHALPADRALAESLQRTVFWRGGLGGGAELSYGEPVAELIRGVPSTALLVSGSRVSASGLVEYTAMHGLPRPAHPAEGGWRAHGQGISKVVIAAGVGLPVSARVYGGVPPPLDHYHPGRPLFEYEMVSPALGAAPGGGQGAQDAQGAGADPISNPHYPVHGGRSRGAAAGGRGGGGGGW